jgi:hypothetical protein
MYKQVNIKMYGNRDWTASVLRFGSRAAVISECIRPIGVLGPQRHVQDMSAICVAHFVPRFHAAEALWQALLGNLFPHSCRALGDIYFSS